MLPQPCATRADDLYLQACQFVLFHHQASVSLLQRRLRIGYGRAMALLAAMCGDILECDADGGNPRILPAALHGPDRLLPHKLAQAATCLSEAPSMVLAVGAGMGADLGLPERTGDGEAAHPLAARHANGPDLACIASPEGLQQHPASAWGLYGQWLQACRATPPHAGLALLLGWARRLPQGCFVVTGNVDGHVQKAGFPAARVYECHGSLHRLQCSAHCEDRLWPTAWLRPQVDASTGQWLGDLPRCPHCDALMRPNIRLQDDWHWNAARSQRQHELLEVWLDSAPQPLVLEVGAGRDDTALRRLTQRLHRRGSRLIRIHPHDADIHNPDTIEFALGIREALQQIGQHLHGSQ